MTKLNLHRGLCLLLLFVCANLIAYRGLNEPDEGRYTEIAREMLVTGDYLVPRIKGVPHFAKPPLVYWSIAASMAIFGVNEFGARFPGFLAAMIVLFLTMDLVRRFGGSRVARWFAVCALMTTVEFFALSQIVTTDMILCAFVVVAMWSRCRALESDSSRTVWNLVFWMALGGGMLTKGPIILMVVFVGLLTACFFERSWRVLRGMGWLWGLPGALALALPWFLILIDQDPDLLDFFIGDEIAARLQSGRGRAQPFVYFFVVLPLVLLPWTFSIIPIGRSLFSRRHKALPLLFGWVLGPFLIFSMSSSKLWTYMLPLIPPAIVILALGFDDLDERRRRTQTRIAWIMGVVLVSFVLVAENRATILGHNASFRELCLALPREEWRGQAITDSLDPATAPPRFSQTAGTKIATYRFRFHAASFYLFGDRPQFVPPYGNGSLWEWQSKQDSDRFGTLSDLLIELRNPEELVLLTKKKHVSELEQELGRRLRVIAEVGKGKRMFVALSNR